MTRESATHYFHSMATAQGVWFGFNPATAQYASRTDHNSAQHQCVMAMVEWYVAQLVRTRL